ncbi:tripartite tricarboxylate transporter TctB family protein [Chelativorans salis]|uniref:Tripartite tricarboxylate transporter TctB family protein n=1 Tax=Chelativorans salis TaxID=2978478 RepID=A0ABT2LSS4_9HYPH|nr:tripartite tricarboxylate transporter TctB family protein [Chelativorans sp. EGI FJ00035]MCT7376678.1 tripartite tricarboxylate transporter TctB family protein [Chelativorans sp. EGI FJ00035]
MNILHKDTVSGAALLALAVLVVSMSLDMGTGAGGETLTPSFVPRICAAGLVISGAFLLLRGLRSEGGMPAILDRRIAIVMIALVFYLWFFHAIDVRFGVWAFTLATMLAFGIRAPLMLILYPVALSAILYLSFSWGFRVVLPTWI